MSAHSPNERFTSPEIAAAEDKPPATQATTPPDLIAEEILRGVSRLMVESGLMPIAEFILPDGRRADVAALDREGRITIVEIKSSLADFRSDRKWPEYANYCDCFFFAVKPDFPREALPEDCGLILADRYGGEIVRSAKPAPALPGARRRALTLRFARTAAMRLAVCADPLLGARAEAKDV
jgi:hypothetical protein